MSKKSGQEGFIKYLLTMLAFVVGLFPRRKEREAARKAIEEAPPVVKETPIIVQDTGKVDSLTAEVESLKTLLQNQKQEVEAAKKSLIEADARNAELMKKFEDAEKRAEHLQESTQRLEEKLSNIESENQVLRQQALTMSPTGKSLSARPRTMIIQVPLFLVRKVFTQIFSFINVLPKPKIYSSIYSLWNKPVEEDEIKVEEKLVPFETKEVSEEEKIIVEEESVLIPQFKITEVHVAGVKAEPAPSKKPLWGSNTKQQQAGSRWLVANGMGKKNANHPLMKSKAANKSSGSINKVDPPVRNPNVIIPNETVKLLSGAGFV